jgi:hypothetical protein
MKVTFDTSNHQLAGAFGITQERVNELADLNEKFLEENCTKPDFDFGQCIVATLDRAQTVEEVAFLMWVTALSKDHIGALVQLNIMQAQVNAAQAEGGENDN